MDRSQYLVAALQGLQQQPQITTPTVDAQGLAALGKKAQAYHLQDPNGSFIGHQLMQAGRNVIGAPGAVVSGLGRFAQSLPGVPKPQGPIY